ncbi:MAG: polymerase sigma factor, sigma-70 family [Verrucomicrobiaceae bacterium]|nr:polymerase sigma factor, sigma-70 family [Verrucomicrobiaceae bacterium]
MAYPPTAFPPTSHTLLEKVRSDDPIQRKVAMEAFCKAYQAPIHALARKLGFSFEDAQDLTQEMFLKVIKGEVLQKFERERGTKFSAWLMVLFKNLTLHYRQSRATLKRGGAYEHVPFDGQQAEQAFQQLHQSGMEAPLMFDLMLARQIWEQTRTRIHAKYERTAYAEMVAELEPIILLNTWPQPPSPTQAEFALKHGTTAAQLRTFLSRNLRSQAGRHFAEEAAASSPGITAEDTEELWQLLREHAGT